MTNHEYGAFHAAARAVSGGPVYVTDSIGEHDFQVISALRMSDGTVPLCEDVAVPTPDCLMVHPQTSAFAYKIMNRNKFSSVLAAFHTNTEKQEVTGILDEPHYSFRKQALVSGTFTLLPKEFDIFTKPTVSDGFAVFGLTAFYNMGGTVKEFQTNRNTAYIQLLDTGTCAVYCDTAPKTVLCGNLPVDFSYRDGILRFYASDKKIQITK